MNRKIVARTAADTGTLPPIRATWSPDPGVESDPGPPTDMPNLNLTPGILAAALQGLEAQKARFDAHIAEVRRMPGARPKKPAAPAEAPKPKRRMSAAARKRIAAAQKKRRAEYHRKKAKAVKPG